MDFLRLNYRKLSVWWGLGIITIFLFFILVNKADVTRLKESAGIIITLAICFPALFVTIQLVGGIIMFRRTEHLKNNQEIIQLFDNRQYGIAVVYQKSLFQLTRVCILGKIQNYPVKMYMNTPANRSLYTTLDFDLYTLQLPYNRPAVLSIKLDSFGEAKEDINAKVTEFIINVVSGKRADVHNMV